MWNHAAAITKSDSTELDPPTRALYIGGAGNVSVTTTSGETVTFTGVLAGTILPLQLRRVNSASTTATAMVGLW